MAPHEKSCFYADVKKTGEKIGFYFAVFVDLTRFKKEGISMLIMK
jgi:hypothetical protein